MKKPLIRLLTLLTNAVILISCSNDLEEIQTEDINTVETREYFFDTDENSNLMFYDGEPLDVITSSSRKFKISEIITIKPLDNYTIEISNYAPIDLEDVLIVSQINGTEQSIQLFKIKKIRAHAISTIKYPFVEGQNLFLGTDNSTIDLSAYRQNGIPKEDIGFDFTGQTVIINKLKSLSKLSWAIKFHDFDPNNSDNNNWKNDITPKDIRRYTGLLINIGYVISQNQFKEAFINEHLTNNNQEVMSQTEKENQYQRLLDKPFLRCGVVVNVSGLGGGATFGLSEGLLKKYLINGSYGRTATHELGHTLGFNHSSNMTYPITVNNIRVGFSVIGKRFVEMMLQENELPISKDNYYLNSDF